MRSRQPLQFVVLLIVAVLGGCGGRFFPPDSPSPMHPVSTPDHPGTAPGVSAVSGLPGMPALVDSDNVYAAAGAEMLSPVVRADRPLVYVPHTNSGDVWVIDPATFTVISLSSAPSISAERPSAAERTWCTSGREAVRDGRQGTTRAPRVTATRHPRVAAVALRSPRAGPASSCRPTAAGEASPVPSVRRGAAGRETSRRAGGA